MENQYLIAVNSHNAELMAELEKEQNTNFYSDAVNEAVTLDRKDLIIFIINRLFEINFEPTYCLYYPATKFAVFHNNKELVDFFIECDSECSNDAIEECIEQANKDMLSYLHEQFGFGDMNTQYKECAGRNMYKSLKMLDELKLVNSTYIREMALRKAVKRNAIDAIKYIVKNGRVYDKKYVNEIKEKLDSGFFERKFEEEIDYDD